MKLYIVFYLITFIPVLLAFAKIFYDNIKTDLLSSLVVIWILVFGTIASYLGLKELRKEEAQ